MKNGTTKWLGIGIPVLVLVLGVAGTFAIYGRDISDLKDNGCGPSRVHTTQIAVIETRLEAIEADLKTGFDTVIKLLGEKQSSQPTKTTPETSSQGVSKI